MKNVPVYVNYSDVTCNHAWIESKEIGSGFEVICKFCGVSKKDD